jgi:hypothetical protein
MSLFEKSPSAPNFSLARKIASYGSRRFGRLAVIAVLIAVGVSWIGMCRIRAEIRQACEPTNSAIEAVAAVIRRQQASPLEQVALVELAANHLLDYDCSGRVYGPGVPTVSEMLSRRREAHWLYPHGDCKEHAVIAGSILSALGIAWEPVASFPIGHAWVRVHLAAGDWDIMAAPLGNWSRLGSAGLQAVSFLAGGSAVPLHAPSADLVQQGAERLARPRPQDDRPSWQDAAVLGVVIVTPHGIFDHAPVDYAAPEGLRIVGDAFRLAKVSGFPFGDPL